ACSPARRWLPVTIAVVQSKAFSGASSGSFTADITATSAVMLWIFQYTTSGAAMSSSAPTFNGSASGFTPVKIMEAQSPGTNAVYGACWMLPDLAGGAASIGITASGGVVDGNVGMVAIEVSGLGAAPQLDAGATPNPEVTALASGTVASGPTGAITASPELILGMAVIFGATFAAPGSPWTSLGTGSGLDSA